MDKKDIAVFLAFLVLLLPCCQLQQPHNSDGYWNNDAETVGEIAFADNSTIRVASGVLSAEFAHGGTSSVKLNKDHIYGFSISLPDQRPGQRFQVSVWRKGTKGELVISSEEKKLFAYVVKQGGPVDVNGWQQLTAVITIPPDCSDGLTAYVWNSNEEPVWFDDMEIRMMDPPALPKTALSLHIPADDFDTLLSLRSSAIRKGQIARKHKEKFPAQLTADNQSFPVFVRYKGDWTDHIASHKWSMRVSMDTAAKWHGFTTFSVQSPTMRGMLSEWVTHELAKGEGLLTTQYEFVPLVLNGYPMGVYAVEEHFTLNLPEANERNRGPILKWNEDPFMAGALGLMGNDTVYFPWLDAAAIDVYDRTEVQEDEKLWGTFLRGQDLLQGFRSIDVPAHTCMDVDKMARMLALLDLTRGHHATRWHNQRFYLDPERSLLEPVLYDCFGSIPFDPNRRPFSPHIWVEKAVQDYHRDTDLNSFAALFDPVFRKAYRYHIERMMQPAYLDSAFAALDEQLQAYENLLQPDYPGYHFDREAMRATAANLRARLPAYDAWIAEAPTTPPAVVPVLCLPENPTQYISLCAYRESNALVSMANAHCRALLVTGWLNEKESVTQLSTPIAIAGYDFATGMQFSEAPIPAAAIALQFHFEGDSDEYIISIVDNPRPKKPLK